MTKKLCQYHQYQKLICLQRCRLVNIRRTHTSYRRRDIKQLVSVTGCKRGVLQRPVVQQPQVWKPVGVSPQVAILITDSQPKEGY
ncbi:MAG: hypothetical protein ACTSSH_08560 [Candidatus Heimdallarchaeota archaeon]